MRRIVVAALGTISGLVLLFSYHTSTNRTGLGGTPLAGAGGGTPAPTPSPGSPSPAPGSAPGGSSSSSTPSSGLKDGTWTGQTAQTRWGPVQVAVTVAGGTITKVDPVVYPANNGRDMEINSYALPILDQEALSAQSSQIDAVSGATVTSDGYIASLQSAIDQATS